MSRATAVERADWWGTGVFTATAVGAVLADGAADAIALVLAVALFATGCVVFVWAYAVVVGRSRREQIGVAEVYLLTGGTAPPPVKRRLMGALGTQVAVALGTSIAQPYTSLAAGTLVPLYGLALCGLWSARHATFPPRPAQ